MNTPENLKYTKNHVWVKIEGNSITIGITEFAAKKLGDIVFVEINTIGDKVSGSDIFGTIEAVKTVSDLFMPITATINTFNTLLEDSPESINKNAYDAWLIKATIANNTDMSELLDAKAYKAIIEA